MIYSIIYYIRIMYRLKESYIVTIVKDLLFTYLIFTYVLIFIQLPYMY